jgi:hypothetical protein
VSELTNNNSLLTNNGLIGEGGRLEASKIDDYAELRLEALGRMIAKGLSA